MNSQEVLQAFREDTPVRFGDLVFSRIDSVNYKRARYNQFIESTDLDGNTSRRPKTLKIIQAICADQRGNEYVLNPLRLEAATPEEVNIPNEYDHTLTERLKLLDIFNAWCEAEGQTSDAETLIAFLFAEGLINPGKAYDIVKAFERQKEG